MWSFDPYARSYAKVTPRVASSKRITAKTSRSSHIPV
jgi:hypothetical protein